MGCQTWLFHWNMNHIMVCPPFSLSWHCISWIKGGQRVIWERLISSQQRYSFIKRQHFWWTFRYHFSTFATTCFLIPSSAYVHILLDHVVPKKVLWIEEFRIRYGKLIHLASQVNAIEIMSFMGHQPRRMPRMNAKCSFDHRRTTFILGEKTCLLSSKNRIKNEEHHVEHSTNNTLILLLLLTRVV